MSWRRQLGVSFGVQGVGAAAVLLATVWLGARQGPEVQGGFSRTKSEIEFVAAFAMFGLPQALFYFVKSGGLRVTRALRWALASAALALPIGGLYGALQHPDAGGRVWALAALAIGAAVAHGQMRALVLAGERTVWFNLVTAAPQVGVLVGVAAVIAGLAAPVLSTWFGVFALASGATAMLAWRRVQRLAAQVPGVPDTAPVAPASTTRWPALAHYGLAAWLTAALATAAILAMQHWVEAAQGRAALGRFTLALTLAQVPLTPIAYAAPLLLRRWMEQSGARASRRWAGVLFGLLLGVAGLAGLLAWRWPDLAMGPDYAGATAALAVLLAGGAAEAASRVLTVQASATGLPWIAVRAESVRWLALGVGWLAFRFGGAAAPGLLPLCATWAGAAALAALVFAWHGRAAAEGAA